MASMNYEILRQIHLKTNVSFLDVKRVYKYVKSYDKTIEIIYSKDFLNIDIIELAKSMRAGIIWKYYT